MINHLFLYKERRSLLILSRTSSTDRCGAARVILAIALYSRSWFSLFRIIPQTASWYDKLTAAEVDANTVVAVSGLASLFGLTYASAIFETVAPSVQGRLLVFFPGQHNGSNYRFLDARDGWNYLAVPITGMEG